MSGAHVFIDRSQFPENVRRDLVDSLRARAINHKFHYDSYKQAAKWLALHEAYSPARTDESGRRIYDDAFRAALEAVPGSGSIHLVGLGCGGGQKEARLVQLLGDQRREIVYTPSDVSLPLLLTAREAALAFLNETQCRPVVCDLGTSEGLAEAIDASGAGGARLVTLFGILPNFEPAPLLSRISLLLGDNDWLLISANLAPGMNYADGVQSILPQYDNGLTRDWLMTLLLDLGFERDDGELSFAVETDARELHRITTHFQLKRAREVRVFGEHISFQASERIRLFFSYRHTIRTFRTVMGEYNLKVCGEWLNDSAEEGVFLCRKVR